MLESYSIIETAILSIIIIFTIHYLFDYLKNTLTIYKTNNVLHKHNEKYQEILDIMQSTQTNQNTSNPTSPRISMKDELKNFLRGSNQGN
jgi:hypothetical protein|tara:strand:- start:2862 stop:3131 length:270 start_codon:yes stop_codon:yes gene_type:complete